MMRNNKGFILLLTFIFMTILTVFTGALIYMTTIDMRNVAPQSDDVNLGSLADAGIDRAHREIRDDYLTTTSTGAADLRGADTSLSSSVSSEEDMRHIDGDTAQINNNSDQAIITIFDSNYTQTRIISIQAHIIAKRQSGGGAGASATIQLAYTTDGVNYTPVLIQLLSTSLVDYPAPTLLPSSLTWPQLMSSNFRLRAMRTGGSRNVDIDAMYLRVAYSIDTLTEPWATGSYTSFPIVLGDGTIQSVTITDEERKVHLNYGSQALIQNLLTNLGIGSASTKATNIVNYRGGLLTNPFDSVEELQQVTGITASDYNSIMDYVTVYSFINQNAYNGTEDDRTIVSRPPININTAPFEVLKAVFDPISLGAGDSTSLANDIITFRNSTPFECFYSSSSAVTTDFYDFVDSRAYISDAERDRILDNCDASSLIPVPEDDDGYNCVSTEFCYASAAFYINALARAKGRDFRVKTIRGNDGSHTFSTYVGDPTTSGWRKENFE